MQEFDYFRPQTVSELKGISQSSWCQDLGWWYGYCSENEPGEIFGSLLVDPSGVNSLRFIEDQGKKIILGALTTHQEFAESTLTAQCQSCPGPGSRDHRLRANPQTGAL